MASHLARDHALADACTAVGLSATGAQVIYERSNAVYRLADGRVVARLRYAPGSAEWMARLSASVQVTAWLHMRDFPAVRPWDVSQPVTAQGYIVTFWHLVPEVGPPWSDISALAHLLRRLHEQPDPPVDLPATNPLGSLRADVNRCPWLPEPHRAWLESRCDDLERQYGEARWTLGHGLLHGDAYTDNLIHTHDGVLLADWDSVSYGPREQDLVPTKMRYRFGQPASEWEQFCSAYGIDPVGLHGLPVLQQMRELRALAAYIRSHDPAAKAEVGRRITDLMSGSQDRPWTALNLAQ
jgi:aminoglycoside phosphotransferase (APT) family kinase protein